MTGRNNSLAGRLTPGQERRLLEQLLALLSAQARLYTGGESTSLPVETAQELFSSILCCLKLDHNPAPAYLAFLAGGQVERAFALGQRRIQLQLFQGKQLWTALCRSLPPVENRSMTDTLMGLRSFWARYDPRFFAHQVPCDDIDYQLSQPVPEHLLGINYVNRYLHHLAAENDFLCRFSSRQLIPLLERCCPDYRGLLVNLYQPAAANALGLTLLGADTQSLLISREQREALEDQFRPLSRPELDTLLRAAAQDLSRRLGLQTAFQADYLSACALSLSPRILLALDVGGMSGLFPGP